MWWRWTWSACSAARRSLPGTPLQPDGKSSGNSTSSGATGRKPHVYDLATACICLGCASPEQSRPGGRAVSDVTHTAAHAGQFPIDQHALQQMLLAADAGL